MSMQLADAIEDWVSTHRAGLSASTRRNITDIAIAADSCGYGHLECIDIREPQRLDIIADADIRSGLNAQAIGQFLAIVVEWGLDDDEPDLFAPSPAVRPDPPVDLRADHLPSDNDQWLIEGPDNELVAASSIGGNWLADDRPATESDDVLIIEPSAADELAPTRVDDVRGEPQVVDDLHADSWVDELPPVTEPHLDNAVQLVEVADVIEANQRLIDEDHFHADELAEIDADLAFRIESVPDESAPDESEPDDFVADASESDDEANVIDARSEPPAPPAAASFLRTLNQSSPNRNVFEDLSTETTSTRADANGDASGPAESASEAGIFSEAAQYEPGRSVDWITVLYFTVAALCFAFVIYLYLSN